jgi:hypothetical protein
MTANTTDDLIAALAEIPDRLETLAAQAGGGASPGTASPDAWTPSEVAGHLCDSARYWGARMRRVVYEQSPAMDMFDEDTMVRLAAYRYWPLTMLLCEFRLLSADTTAFLRDLPADAWQRSGVHPERGTITLNDIIGIEAAHEQNHVRQFAAALGVGADSSR